MASVRNVLLLMLSVAMAAPIAPTPIDEEKANIQGMTQAEKADIPSRAAPSLAAASELTRSKHHSEPMHKAAPPTIIVNSGDVASSAEANALHPAKKPHEGFTGPNVLGAAAEQLENGSLGNNPDSAESKMADDFVDNMKKNANELNARQLGAGELVSRVPNVLTGIANKGLDAVKQGLHTRQLPTDLVGKVPGFVTGLLPGDGLVSRDEEEKPQGQTYKGQAQEPKPKEGFPAPAHAEDDHADGLTGNLRPAVAMDAVHLGTKIEHWVEGGINQEEKNLPKAGNNNLEPRQGLSGGNLPSILLSLAQNPDKLKELTKGIKLGNGGLPIN